MAQDNGQAGAIFDPSSLSISEAEICAGESVLRHYGPLSDDRELALRVYTAMLAARAFRQIHPAICNSD